MGIVLCLGINRASWHCARGIVPGALQVSLLGLQQRWQVRKDEVKQAVAE